MTCCTAESFHSERNALDLLGVVLEPPRPDVHPQVAMEEVMAGDCKDAVLRVGVGEANQEGLGEVLGHGDVFAPCGTPRSEP